MLGLAHRGFSMNDYRKHILYTLRDAGYQSILGGLQHIADKPERIGYDEILKPKSTRAADVAPARGRVPRIAARRSRSSSTSASSRPTASIRKPTAADDPRYTQPPMPIPDTPRDARRHRRRSMPARAFSITASGRCSKRSSVTGSPDNTLVISTTDHGLAFPLMKCNLTDSGWGVSLIMRGPGAVPRRQSLRRDDLADRRFSDPLRYAATEAAQPGWKANRSCRCCAARSPEINEEIFAEVNYHASYEPKRAVRTQRWKYIRRYGDRTAPVLPNCDDGPEQVALAGAQLAAADARRASSYTT